MEAFAWIEWLVLSTIIDMIATNIHCSRILVTIAIITVLIRAITSSRRGDGMRGGLVAA
jgi:hypothetical protein